MRHITLPYIPKPILLLIVVGVPLVMLPFVKAATSIVELSVWLPWLAPDRAAARSGQLAPTAFDFLPLALFGLVSLTVALSGIVGLRRKAPVRVRMSTLPDTDVRRLTDLRGMPVIDLSKARRMGYVMDLIVDPKRARLTALDLGTTGRTERIPFTGLAQLRVGHQAVVFVAPTSPSPNNNREAYADGVLTMSSLLGLDVFTDTGSRLGKIANAYVDAKTLHLVAYVLRRPFLQRLFEAERLLEPDRLIGSSPELLLVREEALEVVTEASWAEESTEVMPPVGLDAVAEVYEPPAPELATVLATEDRAA